MILFFEKCGKSVGGITEEALNTRYIQDIKSGTLHPSTYGAFNVSDAYYCFNGANDYAKAEKRAEQLGLKSYLTEKQNSYAKYNKEFTKSWHIKDAEGVIPTPVCKDYSDFETKIATQRDPVYCIPLMLPCEYLWSWIASELAESPPVPNNLYQSWITDNDDPKGAYAMGNFINQEPFKSYINDDEAISIYKQAITYEFKNFKTATHT